MESLFIILFITFLTLIFYAKEQFEYSLFSADLQEVVVVGSGFIDLAEDRKTPSANSTLTAEDFELRGTENVWLPQTLKLVPGAYGDQTKDLIVITPKKVDYFSEFAQMEDAKNNFNAFVQGASMVIFIKKLEVIRLMVSDGIGKTTKIQKNRL